MPFFLAVLFATPGLALAHSFGPVFNLPMPFWMYAWLSAAALLLSFLMTAYFSTQAQTASKPELQNLLLKPWLRTLQRSRILSLGRLLSVGLLALGLSYLSLIIGNVYAVLNP